MINVLNFYNDFSPTLLSSRKRLNDYSPSSKNTLNDRLIEGFQVDTDFTATNANLSLNQTYYKLGGNSLSVEMTNAGANTLVKENVSFSMANYQNVELEFYISTKSQLQNVTIYFFNNTNQGGNNAYYQWSCNSYGRDGWNKIRVAKDDFTITTFDWNDIKSIQITLQPNAATPTIYLASLKKNIKTDANVCIWLDDAFASAYDFALPLLAQYGFKANIAAYQTVVGTANHMTLAQIQELYNTYGWDIINHSNSHISFASSNYKAVTKEIQDMRDYLIAAGITRSVYDVFAYPTGYSTLGAQVVSDLGFKFGRASVGGPLYFPFADNLNLMSIATSPSTNASTVTNALGRLSRTGGLINVYFHDLVVSPTGVDYYQDRFTTIIEYLNTNRSSINVITATEAYNSLFD